MFKLNFIRILSINLVFLLAGCFDSSTALDHVTSAKQLYKVGDVQASIIELKNALSKDPLNFDARFLLGKIYFEDGDFIQADKELSKAYEFNDKNPSLNLYYAKTLYFFERYDDSLAVLSSNTYVTDLAIAEKNYYSYLSYYSSGQKEKAFSLIDNIDNEIDIEPYKTLFSILKLLKASNNMDDSAYQMLLDKKSLYSDNIDYLQMLEKLAVFKNDFQSVVFSLEQQARIFPSLTRVKLSLIDNYIRIKEYEKAEKELSVLLAKYPNNGYLNLYQGIIEQNRNQCKLAKSHAEIAIQSGISNPTSRYIAGVCAFVLNEFESSYQHLMALSSLEPNNENIKRLTSLVQLKLGVLDKAVANLSDFSTVNDADLSLFVTAGFESIKQGNKADASEMLDKALQLESIDDDLKVKVGLLDFSLTKNTDLLEKTLNVESDISNAALASAYLYKKEFDKALALAQAWLTQDDKNVAAYNLAGFSASQLNEIELASGYFTKSLALNDANPMALSFFAERAFIANDVIKMKKYLTELVNKNPNNMKGFIQLFVSYQKSGLAQEGIDKLKSSYDNNANLLYLYALALHSEKQYDKVISLLSHIKTTETTESTHWYTLASSYAVTNKISDAVATYKQWAGLKPNEVQPFHNLIYFYEKKADYKKGLSFIREAISFHPSDMKLQIAELHFMLKAKELIGFNKKIAEIESTEDNVKILLRLKAEFEVLEKNYGQAAIYYEKLYKKLPTLKSALTVYRAIKLANNTDKANRFLLKHAETNPTELGAWMIIGNDNLTSDKKTAKYAYLHAIKLQPENIIALNNLSSINSGLEQHHEALKYALLAFEYGENNPEIVDTLAMSYYRLNDTDNAVKYITKANALANGLDKSILINALNIYHAVSDLSSLSKLKRQIEAGELNKDPDILRVLSKIEA
jgi:putative PEP-CTERM system TPR-repeat lipoprotein